MGTTSFSMEVKEEMLKNFPQQRHCRIAEIAAIIATYGKIRDNSLIIASDNERITQKYFTLLKKTFNISADAFEKKGFFEISVTKEDEVKQILQAVKILNSEGNPDYHKGIVSNVLLKSSCCKRVFLRSIFVALGTVNAPDKGSHLEFVCSVEEHANQIMRELQYFGIKANKAFRKNHHVVYIKEGNGISDFLRVAGANVATMTYENSLILREIANATNRRVNCEVANTGKQIDAAYRQINDINYLNECIGISNLPETLQSVARARLENPDVGLKELGELMKPPLGKSGVNHRLRKISELAQKHRETNA